MGKRKITSRLFKEANKYLVGGVNSPVRAFNYVGGNPLVISKGIGSKVYDCDGNEYIDYVLSWGSLILGHAFKSVINAVKKTANNGLSYGTTNASEIKLAKLICDAIPFVEKIRFTNSGTEAVMGAIRLARGYTGRDKIVKFENSYHGHADYLLVKGGSGLATLKIPFSLGVPDDFIKHTLSVPYGDKNAIDKIFRKYKKEIAAVIFEPVGGNHGVIPPDIEFMEYLREITKQNKTFLIADEVITGFRFNYGSFAFQSGIIPDLICLGKIIGGGMPVGAYGGRNKIMDLLAPLGKVYQASTFSGNPVTMEAGIAVLETLSKKRYESLNELTELLCDSVKREASLQNINLSVTRFGSMFSLKHVRKEGFSKFYKKILDSGIYFAPSEFESNSLSFAHTEKDIYKTIAGVKSALADI